MPLAVAGAAGMQAYSQYQTGKAEQRWQEYQAELLRKQAKEEEQVAFVEAKRFRKAGERLKAEQRVRYAKAGVMLEGTPMDVLEATAVELETDALMIERGGWLRKERFETEAVLSRMKGGAARRAGRRRMAGTLLGGGAQAGMQYGRMKGWWQ